MALSEGTCNGCGLPVKIGNDYMGHRIALDPAMPVWAIVELTGSKRTALVRTGLSMAEHVCERRKQ